MLTLSFLLMLSSLTHVSGAPFTDKLPHILPVENGKFTYSETVDCGNVTQGDLFRRARLCIVQSASDQKILLTDRETGDLVSLGSIEIILPRSESAAGGIYRFRYTLTVEYINRRYRATISHVETVENTTGKTLPAESFKLKSDDDQKALFAVLDQKLKTTLAELQQYLQDYKSF